MSSNRVTLAQLIEMEPKEVSALPLDQIETLLEDVAELKATAAKATAAIEATMVERFGISAAALRAKAGKDTGKVNVPAGDYVVSSDLPKRVEWDQDELAKGVAVVATWEGENVGDYVDVTYSIPERRWDAWPASIKRVFQAARTVKTGKATFKLERADSKRRAA